jgi:hypothetical protein
MLNMRVLLITGLAIALGGSSPLLSEAHAQASAQRAALLPFVGQEVLVVDTTSGDTQFQHTDALLVYRLKLDAVRQDFIIVSRNVEGDKRAFVYPLSVIRRIRTDADGHPLRPIVIELY